jgi:hypothetical protein
LLDIAGAEVGDIDRERRQAGNRAAGGNVAGIVHSDPHPGDADQPNCRGQRESRPAMEEQQDSEGEGERRDGVSAGHRDAGLVREQLVHDVRLPLPDADQPPLAASR